MTELFALALEIQDGCQENGWPFCVIGGLAVQHWGEPRFMEVSLHDAKTHRSRLIEAVEGGEEIVGSRRNKPVARIVAASGTHPRRIGALAGRPFRMGEGFDSVQAGEVLTADFGVPAK